MLFVWVLLTQVLQPVQRVQRFPRREAIRVERRQRGLQFALLRRCRGGRRRRRGEQVDLNNTLELDDMGVASITRREARLLEVSLTPTPAYAGAQVSLVRSRAPHEAASRRRSAELDAWRQYLDKVK